MIIIGLVSLSRRVEKRGLRARILPTKTKLNATLSEYLLNF